MKMNKKCKFNMSLFQKIIKIIGLRAILGANKVQNGLKLAKVKNCKKRK